jgi:hypothetical protein
MTPERPPMVNIAMKPSENNIGVLRMTAPL